MGNEATRMGNEAFAYLRYERHNCPYHSSEAGPVILHGIDSAGGKKILGEGRVANTAHVCFVRPARFLRCGGVLSTIIRLGEIKLPLVSIVH
jgi:hypothetical protein